MKISKTTVKPMPQGGPPQGMPAQAQGTPQGGPPQGMPMGGPPQGMPPQAQGDPMKRQQMMANMMRSLPMDAQMKINPNMPMPNQ